MNKKATTRKRTKTAKQQHCTCVLIVVQNHRIIGAHHGRHPRFYISTLNECLFYINSVQIMRYVLQSQTKTNTFCSQGRKLQNSIKISKKSVEDFFLFMSLLCHFFSINDQRSIYFKSDQKWLKVALQRGYICKGSVPHSTIDESNYYIPPSVKPTRFF